MSDQHRVKTFELGRHITRRDFIGTTLVGAGAMLLQQACPAQEPGELWTGYGGVGDYRFSNGNTAEVMQSAHRIRDQAYRGALTNVIDTGETFDAVVVGGGFTGLMAFHEFKKRSPHGTCLLLDNHPIFGGFAKWNEFDVDGCRLLGPQASINFLLPKTDEDRANSSWDELGLPHRFEFAEPEGAGSRIVFPRATSAPLYYGEQTSTVGYYFQDSPADPKGVWVKDIWKGDLQTARWPESYRKGLLALRDRKMRFNGSKEEAIWLDSMTLAEFVTGAAGLSSQILSYITLGLLVTGPQISGYFARSIPGIDRYSVGSASAERGDRWMSFPGGNTTQLRHIVKALFPAAIQGPRTFEAIANNPVNLSALDQRDATCKMRLSATVVSVSHEGDPNTADHVTVLYEKGGRVYRTKAQGAVLATGNWVTKHIVSDLPTERHAALDQFLYAPILMVNVALRNWRFLDKLGFSTARWFDGFGFYCTVRRPMIVGDRPAPFHPDKPIVMTFYVPIQNPELPLGAQGPAGRAQLFGTSYADYERRIVEQMRRMFASGGFDARRDIAGIVLNRWGHAFITPAPGFFFGKNGRPSPSEVAKKPFGRIVFGAGYSGSQSWDGAAADGKRAATELLSML